MAPREIINLGAWTEESLDRLIRDAALIEDPGERVDALSARFLETPYQEATLIGSPSEPETFVLNLAGVDCFTFLDYVEALRRSDSFVDVKELLRNIRYRAGEVDYTQRNHFFTDWAVSNADGVSDVTAAVGGAKAVRIRKTLNRKGNGSPYVPGIPPTPRDLAFIPAGAVDKAVLAWLRTGDYIGIYSPMPGLDVSHVGICIRRGDRLFLRHASSSRPYRKVIDQDFREYIAAAPGIIVLRPV